MPPDQPGGLQIPVIFLTARDDIDDLRVGFRQGGDDYVTKPFSLEELGLRIEALLRRTGASGEAARICLGDLVLDEDAHQVFNNGAEVRSRRPSSASFASCSSIEGG